MAATMFIAEPHEPQDLWGRNDAGAKASKVVNLLKIMGKNKHFGLTKAVNVFERKPVARKPKIHKTLWQNAR